MSSRAMDKLEKDTLFDLYVTQQKPMHLISKELGVAIGTVFNYLQKYGIETRDQKSTFTMRGRKLSDKQRLAMSKRNKGRIVSDDTRKRMSDSLKQGGIGHEKQRSDGYIYVYFPDHPNSSKGGYIMEHILVMEALIGRHLESNECIHHINRKRDDNRKENLKLMTVSEHMSYHSTERWKIKKGGMTYQ